MPTPDPEAALVLSVTRIRARSLAAGLRLAPGFAACGRQMAGALGLVQGALRREDARTFWTLSLWRGIGAMAGFRNDDPHRTWMGNVEALCDESSYARVPWPGAPLPSWPEAEALLRTQGRFTRMARGSEDHKAGRLIVHRRGRIWEIRPPSDDGEVP